MIMQEFFEKLVDVYTILYNTLNRVVQIQFDI